MNSPPTDDEFFLDERQQALPSHLRARHVAMRHACALVANFDATGRELTRVARTLIRLVRAARQSRQRWDDAWDLARRDIGHLIDGDMNDTVKNIHYWLARDGL